MRLVLAVLALALTSAGPALARSGDLRAPDQQAGPTTRPAVTTDLRAPDQQTGPTARPPVTTDLRAPDQQAPLRTPSAAPAPASDTGPQAGVLVAIGHGVAVAHAAEGHTRPRRPRTTISDALVVE
ncbi:MAG: hypothetical protein QOH46_66 [Solirubrobacteraceae bacterium]|nr:hypothetical protein [Solirubrobacteraceae bacterium]